MSSTATTAFAGSFASLPTPLTPWILDVIQSMGHTQMTPVQASTIPLFMKNKDVVVEAVTGSGKTLAFLVPILERLVRRESKLRKTDIGALIITPTRELATQIHSIFSLFLSAQPDSASDSPDGIPEYPPPLLLISSTQSTPTQDLQRFISTGADIVIGTPGRVEEFILGKGKSVVSTRELEVLVLDEADRLLDLGFQAALTRILTHLPKQRRTGLFSATMTDADALSELVRVGLRNPARVIVKVQSKKLGPGKVIAGDKSTRGEIIEERRIPANLQNYYLTCRTSEKIVQLIRIIATEIAKHDSSQFIVYFATCACVDYFYRILTDLLPPSTTLYSLHGQLPPAARTRTLAAFSNSICSPSASSVLLATDVAARGLDLPNVDVVIQFDPPADPKAFSHRCGRTARAGRSGRAWVLLAGRETEYVDFMAVRKIPMKQRAYINEDLISAVIPVVEPTDDDDQDMDTRPEDPAVEVFLAKTRQRLLMDRSIHDQAAKAFVSFVRAYSKHEASYIFRVKDLDLIGVAKSFGLLRLPKMPELKELNREGWSDMDMDWNLFAYADKAQESKRLVAGAAAATALDNDREKRRAEKAEKRKLNSAWSEKVGRREEKEKRKEKKSKKRKWLKTQNSATAQGDVEGSTASGDADDDDEHDGEDWAELAREERMAKKVRRGDVTQRTFDQAFGDL